mmetsp:Transcript_18894/g.34661  ORF Transcript_18894/g.34661 Transcript_18894/m.34661 type:complete len:152 (+) Transcript_18894:53-508(+)
MATGASARQLLEEFKPWVRAYNAGAVFAGVGFGWWDAPAPRRAAPSKPRPPPPSSGEQPESRWKMAMAAALDASAERPPELGSLTRQLVITAPGFMLALRLGRRAREIGAGPGSLALAALPSLSCPLLLYLLGGYPTGAFLRAWSDGRLGS